MPLNKKTNQTKPKNYSDTDFVDRQEVLFFKVWSLPQINLMLEVGVLVPLKSRFLNFDFLSSKTEVI